MNNSLEINLLLWKAIECKRTIFHIQSGRKHRVARMKTRENQKKMKVRHFDFGL